MRIVVTVPWAQRLGGAEALLQTVLDGVRDGEHEFELVFFEHGPWERELASTGFRTTVMPAGRIRQLHRWLATVLRLAMLFRRRRPDLIVNWTAKTQLYGAPASVLAGMADRVIWWQHMIPTGHWMDRCATVLPSRGVGCCSRSAAAGQGRLKPRRRTFVVAPGAPAPNPSDVSSLSIELPTDVPVVGLVGRLQPWKGQDRLLRAQALLRAEGYAFHTLLVGGDAYELSPDYAQSLPALVEELELDDAVTMTGHVPNAGPYIERMDVLVNASNPEPFGIVLLEAMARAVPVLAVNAGGPAEFIEHERTGLLARSEKPEALADELRRLLASPERREKLAQAGRQSFVREFTADALCERFVTVLQSIPNR